MKAIYLYKPPQSENFTHTWVYYRVGSVEAEEAAGTLHAPIEVCRVLWPTFEDVPPMIDTPGITGLESAHPHVCRLLKQQLGVDHERSELIGLLG
jgi:hypothetical protein